MKYKTLIFNEELAEEMGWLPAILLHHISYWVEFNKRRKTLEVKKEGVYWMYQTCEEIADQFPRMTDNTKGARKRIGRKAIEANMKKLEKAGLIIVQAFIVEKNTKINHYRPTDKGRKFSAPTTYRKGQLFIDYDKIEKKSPSTEKEEHFQDVGSALVLHRIKTKEITEFRPTGRAGKPALSPSLDPEPEIPSAQVVAILEAFTPVTVKINYGNKTERQAAIDLITRSGFEQALMLAHKAVEATQLRISGDQYAPSISSPAELNRKITKLIDYISAPKKEVNAMPESWKSIFED